MFQVTKNDLERSADHFGGLVWPVIEEWCGGGEYIDIEKRHSGDEEDPLAILDMRGGIDGLQVLPNRAGVRGISSRIQWGNHSWDTFTIRESRSGGSRTELSKKLYAISTPGMLSPYFTVHAYITYSSTLLSCALAYTHQLIPYAVEHGYQRSTNNNGSATFLAVDWWEYGRAGNFIHIFKAGKEYCSEPLSEAS